MALITNIPREDLKRLVAHLGGHWSGYTAMCRYPAHADRTPSLSIRQGNRGMLVTCHAGLASDISLIRMPRYLRPQALLSSLVSCSALSML